MSYEQFYKLFNWLFFWRIRLSYNTLFQIFNVSISHSFWCKTSTTTYSSLFLNNRPQNAMDVESVLNSIKKSLHSSQNLSDKHLCVSLGKKCLFFGKFGVLCFLVTPVLRFAFCLITDDLDIRFMSRTPLECILLLHKLHRTWRNGTSPPGLVIHEYAMLQIKSYVLSRQLMFI